MADTQSEQSSSPVELAIKLTIAWLGNPNARVSADEVPAFLKSIHATIIGLGLGGEASPADVAPEHVPAVPIRSSVKPDYIVSLIDGRKLKSLKRHLSTNGLTPAQYRLRYGLKANYPMVAATYAAQRREVAQKIGLGRKGRVAQTAATPPAAASAAPEARAAKPTARARAKPRVVKSVNADLTPAPAKRGRPKKAAAPAE